MSGSAKKYWQSLVPQPDWVEDIHHKNGNTQDIINVLLNAYQYNNFQASREMKVVAKELIGNNDLETFYNVWSFVRSNINYKTDDPGKEKIKSPALLFHYGVGDCKSFSLMVAGILSNYNNIQVSFRFTSYSKSNDFEHVYVVAKSQQLNKTVIIDSTIKEFNFEHPYIKKIDYKLTQISHLHGTPSMPYLLRKAKPSIKEAFNDGPKKVVSPRIDISKLSQGELSLELAKANLLIKLNYYGDPSGNFSKAIGLLNKTIQEGLHNYSPATGIIDESLYPILEKIEKAKSRHILQFKNLETVRTEAGISGSRIDFPISDQELEHCIKNLKLTPSSGNLFTKNWVKWNGDKYRLYEPLEECIKAGVLRTWARNNIFETENFKKGSHSLLYEFINSNNEHLLNNKGITKEVIQKSYTEAFANVSGLDLDNVRSYVKNGIAYTAGLSKMENLDPDYSINALSRGLEFRGQPGINEPITAAAVATVIKIIGVAITAIIAAIKATPRNTQDSLYSMSKGLMGESTKADINDFNSKIEQAENLGNMVPLILGGLAVGALLLKK